MSVNLVIQQGKVFSKMGTRKPHRRSHNLLAHSIANPSITVLGHGINLTERTLKAFEELKWPDYTNHRIYRYEDTRIFSLKRFSFYGSLAADILLCQMHFPQKSLSLSLLISHQCPYEKQEKTHIIKYIFFNVFLVLPILLALLHCYQLPQMKVQDTYLRGITRCWTSP